MYVDSVRAEARGRDPDRSAKQHRERVFIAHIVMSYVLGCGELRDGKRNWEAREYSSGGLPVDTRKLPGDLRTEGSTKMLVLDEGYKRIDEVINGLDTICWT